jgi:hypothetical protein
MTQAKVMVLGLILILSFSRLSFASGHGDVSVRINGGCQAYIGDTNTLEIWITNDAPLLGMSPAFEFTSLVNYVWVKPYGNRPPDPSVPVIQEEGDAKGAFGLSYNEHEGLGVWDRIDNQSPDSLMVGGAAVNHHYRLFPMHLRSTLCYTSKFYIPPGEPETPGGFCVDNIFFPPGARWIFADSVYQDGYTPTFQGNPNESGLNPTAPTVCFDVVHRGGGNLDFSNTPSRGNPPLMVFFSGYSAAPVSSWSWNFGDGSSGSGQNPVHIYEAPGFYSVLVKADMGNDTLELCRFAV